ncbi:uncharacterized protein SAPINGB_P004654 [Magnusiomyces paraingens]|uniref:Complex 1 LYR protein domain-containing protein n=1 Tax=Magnusiomyces paraingens TaxID=2606893 RepID=A0A5E8BVT8_9ASCO|nr:uncharacterized protein SAPINGB_P004654 [Saprochaete ingens]VVT55573.1 unnamed protein product [Saprochaete ingens]
MGAIPKVATIDPILYIFGPSSHPNSIRSTKALYKKLHPTSPTSPSKPRKHVSEVLALYRAMQRAAARTMDPVFRHFLRQHIWESFLVNADEPSDNIVRGLIARAHPHLTTLQDAAIRRPYLKLQSLDPKLRFVRPTPPIKNENPKAVDEVIEYCIARINIEEGPLRPALGGVTRLAVKEYPQGKSPAYTLRTLHAPPRKEVSTFREYTDSLERANRLRNYQHASGLRALLYKSQPPKNAADNKDIAPPPKLNDGDIPHAYFRFLAAYNPAQNRLPAQARTAAGASTDPYPEGTVSGASLPRARERTIVRETIKTVLHSVITAPGASPIDHRVMRYLVHSQLDRLSRNEACAWTAVSKSLPIYRPTIKTVDKMTEKNKDSKELPKPSLVLPSIAQALPGSSKEEQFVWDGSKVKISQFKSLRFYKRRILDVMEKSYSIIEDDLGNFQFVLPPPARIRYSKRA